ncbi:MAG: 4-(cytidine 5'-diphospho)-2-C-methyl-D-erythritol kinase [Draconibacterium sp.]|nr:MAG: 4-(cytidine 5'-diphospho)-2-C-methyl-D-erythritol kinase [Draconibacterium sp.]
MISFPNAKINIGLNIVSKRTDGYHNLETLFCPVKITDALEMVEGMKTTISFSGLAIDGNPEENLVLKAYKMLKEDFDLPPVQFHLHKAIPFGAGLGGGSADAAFALKMLNGYFSLKLTDNKLVAYASKIGADCPFFVYNRPVFASGIGDRFKTINIDLSEYKIVIVKPGFAVNTADAYRNIVPLKAEFNLREIGNIPVDEWRYFIKNDFEVTVFRKFPYLNELKSLLYELGAVYASMSGSGSALFGIFRHLPVDFDKKIPSDVLIYR